MIRLPSKVNKRNKSEIENKQNDIAINKSRLITARFAGLKKVLTVSKCITSSFRILMLVDLTSVSLSLSYCTVKGTTYLEDSLLGNQDLDYKKLGFNDNNTRTDVNTGGKHGLQESISVNFS